MNDRVLVTDGSERAALAVVRSLGRAGATVFVSSAEGQSLASSSRFARGSIRVPDALTDPSAFVEAIGAAISELGITILIPITEASLLALLPHRDRWGDVLIPFADAASFAAISDKVAVMEAARVAGIAVPRQWVLDNADALTGLALPDAAFPLVVKPARSVSQDGPQRVKHSVKHAGSRPELLEAVASLPRSAFPLLLQQRIVGPGSGIFLLIWEGRVHAHFAHRRLREKPPSGGVSVYRESVAADPALVNAAVALLQHFGWRGVAMVEFKVDAGTGTPYLMEVNGRFWGSLQLAVDSGVDFPNLLLTAARGAASGHPPSSLVGVRSRWEWGDIDHFLTRLRHSDADLALPPGSPGRWRTFLDICSIRLRDRGEILRFSDPAPFAHESAAWVKDILT